MGGNGSIDAQSAIIGPESLRLLSTSLDIATALLAETGHTSAATATVARLCASRCALPDYGPKVRALVARYTEAAAAGL